MWVFVHRGKVRLELKDVETSKRIKIKTNKRKVKNDKEIWLVDVR